ncbi:NAD(P)-dependent oxidoreductase [Geothrix sp. 21YS21S-4]|uniref:NAD-dependent epimerase/dehydratase family protein n=1 Tax=Geothrix sp. 21YS21S-4 TaxID=3068889 RepID=UPI0027B94B60|nr:NAD(P)-dependent oxidoreductase [Geothrix sp. 21YS21S-4]
MGAPLPEADLREAVDWVQGWERLRGARLFITGGTGFFGKWLLDVMDRADRTFGLGVEAVVLSRNPRAFLEAMPHLEGARWLKLHAGDVCSFPSVRGPFTHLLHGAASSDARHYAADPRAMRQTISSGARRVMEAMQGQTGLRVLFLSSGAVYGPQPPELTHFPEDFPLAPDTDDPGQAYAQGKREAERLIRSACADLGFPCPVARCFAFAGPHLPLDQHFAFGNFIRDALEGRPIRVGGDGTPFRSYLYASEMAAWLWALLIQGESGAYHVGSDRGVSILELARTVGAAAGLPVEVERVPVAGAPPARYVPAVIRMAGELDLRPRVTLEEAVARTLAWHRQFRSPTPAPFPSLEAP